MQQAPKGEQETSRMENPDKPQPFQAGRFLVSSMHKMHTLFEDYGPVMHLRNLATGIDKKRNQERARAAFDGMRYGTIAFWR